MSESTLPTEETLLEQVGWLRNLALRLVRDADVADELTQETVVRALERFPREMHSVRAWLGTVLRNLVSERYRAQRHRAARERAAARPDAQPPTDVLVDQVHAQRRLADALLELEEPYRATVLLRFYEELPPRAIAARQGVPVATVKSRLHRGLAKLREQLDRSTGADRGAWVLALLPLASRAKPVAAATSLTLGGIAVNVKLWTTVTAVALGVIWMSSRSEVAEPARPTVSPIADGAPDSSAAGAAAAAHGGAPSRTGDRVAVGNSPKSNRANAAVSSTIHRVTGRVLDSNGIGIAGLVVHIETDAKPTRSGPGGWFAFETARARLRLEVGAPADAEWVTVRAGAWRADATLDPIVVVARAIDLSGSVVDGTGAPITAAQVRFALPRDFSTRFTDVVDATFEPDWRDDVDRAGAFELSRVPAVSGASLCAVCDGFEPTRVDAPLMSVDMIELRLARTDVPPGAEALHGRVLRPDGVPAPDARVALGFAMTRTNDSGFFALDLTQANSAATIHAVEAGFQPAEQARPKSNDGLVVLRLGPPTLALSIRAVHTDGSPAAGARVMLADPTPFGVMGMLPLQAEGLASGERLPSLALESATWRLNQYAKSTGSARPVESSNAMLPWVETDSGGRATLRGLGDRTYRLQIVDRDLRWSHTTEPVPATAGAEVELRVPDPEAWPELRGRVVTRLGDPVPGVSIVPYLPVFERHVRVPGGDAHVTRWFQTAAVVTADDGSFVMRDVPTEALQFFLISDEYILPMYAGVEYIEDPTDVVVPVRARTHLDVEVADPSLADAIAVRDLDGAPVDILRMRADGHSNEQALELEGGKSGVVTITSDAAELELLKDGVVVESIPLQPRPGVVQRIRR